MMLRATAMMALVFTVSGCTTGDDPMMFTGSIKPEAPTLVADVSPDYAAAYLPQVAGRVDSVRQTSKPDHIFQTVLYSNPGYSDGENTLSLSIAPPSSGSSYFQAPTQRQVVSEMRTALPAVRMQVSSTAGQNLQGPFGYATGRPANGGTCIYAWQIAKDISRSDETGFRKLASSRYAAKVRLRYCHPSMSEAALVSLMSGLRIRQVSDTTIEMLRFAEGSGVAARASYATEPVQARPVVAPVSRLVSTAKPAKTTAVQQAAMPVRNAPRVLKPGELEAYTGSQAKTLIVATTPQAPVKRKSPAIPLPGDLER